MAFNMKNLALLHSNACRRLLDDGMLEDAIRYCIAQGVEPPLPPCKPSTADYEQCVALANETLSDYGWWEKRLKTQASRSAHGRTGEP